MENRDNSSSALWFIVGVAAGAAGAYYLQTEEGKRLRNQVSDQANQLGTQVNQYSREVGTKVNELGTRVNEYGREIGTKAQHQVQNLSGTLNSAIEQGKTYVDEFGTTVKGKLNTAADSATETVSNVESSFQRGMNKAKKKIENNSEKIDAAIEKQKA